jgi:hypothetical protein
MRGRKERRNSVPTICSENLAIPQGAPARQEAEEAALGAG